MQAVTPILSRDTGIMHFSRNDLVGLPIHEKLLAVYREGVGLS